MPAETSSGGLQPFNQCNQTENKNDKGEVSMPVKNPKELFVMTLSHVRQGTERTTKIFQELSQAAQRQDVKQALAARVFISDQILAKIDECFRLIGEKPVQLSGRLEEVFVEDFRRELNEIQNPVAKHLFVLSKAVHLIHLRMGEYAALIAASDITGNYAVGALLESCLADKMALAERTRRMIRNIVETEVTERIAA
jgi:ferritin-like metal-binding protein YciE